MRLCFCAGEILSDCLVFEVWHHKVKGLLRPTPELSCVRLVGRVAKSAAALETACPLYPITAGGALQVNVNDYAAHAIPVLVNDRLPYIVLRQT